MSATMPNSTINKAALAITKLQGWDDWPLWSATICVTLGQTWAYVDGSKPPPSTDDANSKYETWSTEDHNVHQRLFLALSDNIKQTMLLHVDSHVSKLFSILKSQFEASGISAKFYAKQNYENAVSRETSLLGV